MKGLKVKITSTKIRIMKIILIQKKIMIRMKNMMMMRKIIKIKIIRMKRRRNKVF
jgi:hypothetical protein